MQQPELLEIFIAPLERAGIEYMVTGSVAAIFYGEPRLTHDVDFILQIQPVQIEPFLALYPEEEFYRPPADIVAAELSRAGQGHFNLIHTPTGYKADVYPASDFLHRWGLKHRRRIPLPGAFSVWVAPPEYVILRKLQYYREGGSQKHLKDVEGLLAVSGEEIDGDFLRAQIERLGLNEVWEKVKFA
jgi:hypothetical protein